MTLDRHSIPRVAIIDDYQGIALTSTDWTPLKGRVDIDVFRDTILDEDGLVRRLEGYDIICAMRERTKFPRSLLDRLPKLRYVYLHSLWQCDCLIYHRLIATTGLYNAGIDSVYAKSRGIIVSGTSTAGNATLEHIWALILATVRYITVEDVNLKSGNAQWQSTMPLGLAGRTLGLVGVGKLGASTGKVSHPQPNSSGGKLLI